MRLRMLAASAFATTLAAASLALAMPTPVMAKPSLDRPAPFTTHLRYTFDEGETLRAGTIVHDESPRHHHPGRVTVAEGGHLTVVRGVAGRGAGFPEHCAGCRKAVIETPDHIGLDPRRHAFYFGTALKISHRRARGDSNLVQKGFFKQAGGQYKLQLDNDGIPNCVIRGGISRVIVSSTASIADGTWHTVNCRRTPDAVTLTVDGRVVATRHARTGLIANTAPVRIGGHNLVVHNDQYHGVLDNIFLRIHR